MLAISIAYASDPEIYILDEPTAGLDLIARKILMDMLEDETQQGESTILSTHILDDIAENCSYVGIIHFGKSLAEGPIASFGSNARQIENSYLDLVKSSSSGNSI